MGGKAFIAHIIRRPGFALTAILALMVVLPCGADAAPRAPVVLMLVASSARSDNAMLGALIADSFKVELESQGIRVVPAQGPAADDRAIASLTLKKHADFALCAVYTLVGSEIRLNARWINPSLNATVGTASRTGALNLSFDAVVASLVDEIVAGQRQRFADLPPEQVTEAPPAPAAAPQPVAATGVAVIGTNWPPGSLVHPPQAEKPIEPFALSLQSAPFIATFQALNYFPVGLSFSLTGLYRIRVPGGLFGFGMSSGLSTFHGKGAYAEADFYVVPIGVDVLYGTRTGSPLDFFVHLGGGPAVFAAQPTSGASLAKVIPYATGGVGIQLSFLDRMGLSLEAGYTCFFDSPDPIMGFTPSLSFVVRL